MPVYPRDQSDLPRRRHATWWYRVGEGPDLGPGDQNLSDQYRRNE
jgi:hypothetical protein